MSISEVRVDDIHVIRGISLRHVELHWADPYCHFLFFHFIPSLFRSRGEAQEEHGVGYEPSGGNVEDFAPLSERLLWKKTGLVYLSEEKVGSLWPVQRKKTGFEENGGNTWLIWKM